MPGHIVTSYDTELEDLRRSISEMGGIAEKMMTEATDALVRRDSTLAQSVIVADKRLDALQHEIEERSVLLIAKRQPLAIDLRETISAIRVSGDLERIGDLAKNVAKRVVAISDQAVGQKIILGVQHMSDLAEGQLKDVLDAYGSRDVKAAQDVWERDGEIDALYNSLFRELLTYMMEDPRTITSCTHLLFMAKNIERAGDHVTNIAELVSFRSTGQTFAQVRPKGSGSLYSKDAAQ